VAEHIEPQIVNLGDLLRDVEKQREQSPELAAQVERTNDWRARAAAAELGASEQRKRAEAAEEELRELRKALVPNSAQPHRFVAVVGACTYQLNFARLIRVVGPFDTKEAAKAGGQAESERHRPDDANDESSIEFDVVAWQEVPRA